MTMQGKEYIEHAAATMRKGGIVLYPTDTIWGIGCDAGNSAAVERIYAVKGRDHSKSMLVLALWDAAAEWQARNHERTSVLLPRDDRPTTYIVPADWLPWPVAKNLVAEDGSIGVRYPRHAFCEQLLQAVGGPIVSTSANFSGSPSPQSHEDIDTALRTMVDYDVPALKSFAGCGRSSRIVKLLPDKEPVVIRE
ncbi:MAG: L-threonylcarbamoyladenylate synthase [Bacteroidales bacterium]|nr:L-threonylcarbamoyladenylate synthase [Bacteroidales bacterium]